MGEDTESAHLLDTTVDVGKGGLSLRRGTLAVTVVVLATGLLSLAWQHTTSKAGGAVQDSEFVQLSGGMLNDIHGDNNNYGIQIEIDKMNGDNWNDLVNAMVSNVTKNATPGERNTKACKRAKAGGWLGKIISKTASLSSTVATHSFRLLTGLAIDHELLPAACNTLPSLSSTQITGLVNGVLHGATNISLVSSAGEEKISHPGKCTSYPTQEEIPFCKAVRHEHRIPFDVGKDQNAVRLRDTFARDIFTKMRRNPLMSNVLKVPMCRHALHHALCLDAFQVCDTSYAQTPCSVVCNWLSDCFQGASTKTESSRVMRDCGQMCKQRTCATFGQCPPGHTFRSSSMHTILHGDLETQYRQCCEPMCSIFLSKSPCSDGYVQIRSAASTPGDSKAKCCIQSCSSFNCPPGMVPKTGSGHVPLEGGSRGWNTCCEAARCTLPSEELEGYDFTEAKTDPGDLGIYTFNAQGVRCASGFKGNVTYKVCTRAQQPYAVAGCERSAPSIQLKSKIAAPWKLPSASTTCPWLVTGFKDDPSQAGSILKVYYVPDFSLATTLGVDDSLVSVAISGNFLAAGVWSEIENGNVHVFQVDDYFGEVHTLGGATKDALSAAFGRLWQTLLKTIDGPRYDIADSVAFGGQFLAAGDLDNKLRVYKVDDNFRLVHTGHPCQGSYARAARVRVAFGGQFLAAGGHVYKVDEDFRLVHTLEDVPEDAQVAFGEQFLAAWGEKTKVHVYKVNEDFRLVHTLDDDSVVWSVAFGGQFLAAGGEEGVRVYKVDEDFRLVHTLRSTSMPSRSVAFCGQFLAASFEVPADFRDPKVCIYKVDENFRLVHTLEGSSPIAFSS
eukprot:TRINITY_DN13715_c0_g1_i1.p1 TRINITY_DN13715_c0_g1~~TRINITY_DN13715_c0_g1_i1.p1  ORF type:complete len:858 (-),score=111.59 TRINITY_DN13715_c0_g1_i1:128-2644(-)